MSAGWQIFFNAGLMGLVFGVLFGPLRLVGVDFSKWYRNPCKEVPISEFDDGSPLGLFKRATLSKACWTIPAAIWVVYALGGVAASSQGWLPVIAAVGLALGWAIPQGLAEGAWHLGLRLAVADDFHSKLAETGKQPTRSAVWRKHQQEPAAGRRRLIVCCDGTWNQPNQARDTNVVQLLRVIVPDGHDRHGAAVPQIAYYHRGVGTGNILDRFLGGGAGVGLSGSVKACYGFLVDNYRDGDEILLFGFSRGAYVVRSLAGFIDLVGIMPKSRMAVFQQAWDYYRAKQQRPDGVLEKLIGGVKKDIPISCLGVWDTVGALGIPGTRIFVSRYAFHETGLGEHVRHAFHALAIDERRGNFQPAVWVKSTDDPTQILEQVWFPGVHSNIGGGYVNHGLQDATFLWMLSRLEEYHLLSFDKDRVALALRAYEAERFAAGRIYNSRAGFWTWAACPIPRPVCKTDDSEKVHESAFQRGNASGALYGTERRRQWLLAREKAGQKYGRSDFENERQFEFTSPGEPQQPIFELTGRWYDRVMQRITG